MKKSKVKVRSSVSLQSGAQPSKDIYIPPLDELNVKVYSLKTTDLEQKNYAIKVTFFDQVILSGIIKSIEHRTVMKKMVIATGTSYYDPSDYEKMCLFADCPLVGAVKCGCKDHIFCAYPSREKGVIVRMYVVTVNIQPLKSIETNVSGTAPGTSPATSASVSTRSASRSVTRSASSIKPAPDISCCNVDILPLFINTKKMLVRKRMEPMKKPPLLEMKSWENLPLITMQVNVKRNEENSRHHEILKRANQMKLTLIGAYNLPLPWDDEYTFAAATNLPLLTNSAVVNFHQGFKVPKRFNHLSFYPKWENLRLGDYAFTKGDKKFVCDLNNIQNEENIDIERYLSKNLSVYAVVWGSFHRTLLLDRSEAWLEKRVRKYSWPFEMLIYGERGGVSFMAFLNLFNLLYPGEDTVRLAVPLQWINAQAMLDACGCEMLLPHQSYHSTMPQGSNQGIKQKAAGSTRSAYSTSTDMDVTSRRTGADNSWAFIVVEVQLAKPLKKAVIPTPITSAEIMGMLQEMEQGPNKRECTGRGQLERDWRSTVKAAESSLRKVPHYGMTEFCAFNRQLSETRTRVELMTSCWLEAAVYVNNNFVVQEFLSSEDTYEEMLMMSHACLTQVACSTLVGTSGRQEQDPTLRAARHARHMQDTAHALEMYLQVVVQKPRSANSWRELSTCLRDVDDDWANVCINKAVVLDPRHPLCLLAKGCFVFDEDPAAAEPFFAALLALYPFWLTGWVIASAYYYKRELFHMADRVIEEMRKGHAAGLVMDIGITRAWDYELGDWWDHTPLLPGMNQYFDAADLLLRIRAISLAETCLSRAISETGESAASFHLLALCCRLRGNVDDALCHLQLAIDKFGDVGYIRGLQAECFHKKNDTASALASFEKAGSALSGYSILLSMPCWEATRARSLLLDLIRRQPSAYAWVALAEDWMKRASGVTGSGAGDADVTADEQTTAKTCAAACAVQALKYDRQAGCAWGLLAKLVVPSARRLHCQEMAQTFLFTPSQERMETGEESQQSLCHGLGRTLRECRCFMCEHLSF